MRELLGARSASDPGATEHDSPSLLELFRDRAVLRAVVVVIAVAPLISFTLNWGSVILDKTYHVSQFDMAHYLWLPPLMFDACSVLFGVLASRTDRRNPHAMRQATPRIIHRAPHCSHTTCGLMARAARPISASDRCSQAVASMGAEAGCSRSLPPTCFRGLHRRGSPSRAA